MVPVQDLYLYAENLDTNGLEHAIANVLEEGLRQRLLEKFHIAQLQWCGKEVDNYLRKTYYSPNVLTFKGGYLLRHVYTIRFS
jgi:hypothetical protein